MCVVMGGTRVDISLVVVDGDGGGDGEADDDNGNDRDGNEDGNEDSNSEDDAGSGGVDCGAGKNDGIAADDDSTDNVEVGNDFFIDCDMVVDGEGIVSKDDLLAGTPEYVDGVFEVDGTSAD